MMKKIVTFLVCTLLLVPMLLVGCSKEKNASDETVKVYLFNSTEGKLVAEDVPVVIDANSPKEMIIDQVIKAIYKGAQAPNTQMNMPKDIKIDIKDKNVMISFSDSYNTLTAQEQIVLRTCFVLSLTDLDFVEGVEFFVQSMPIKNSNGEKIGLIKKSDILISAIDPQPPTSIQKITLYFAKQDDTKLYKEVREIQVNNNTPLERYVVEEIIKGPQTPGLIATVAPTTKINGVKTQDGVCQVDFSYDFKSKQYASPQSEKLMVYSIVNSLTEIPKTNIQKVTFLLDGKKQTDVTTSMDFSTLFERDESLVGK